MSWVSQLKNQHQLDFDKGFMPAKGVGQACGAGAVDVRMLPFVAALINNYNVGLPFKTIIILNDDGLISLDLMFRVVRVGVFWGGNM